MTESHTWLVSLVHTVVSGCMLLMRKRPEDMKRWRSKVERGIGYGELGAQSCLHGF
jgi:hypothetical protein